LESELFGHEKGAFTGADQRRKGLFELADGGTVFLDEIGDLAPELQPKLLKILEDREFRRLGGTSPVAVDIRLIAATNRDLRGKVESGEFREDLYYRLNVVPIVLPPLRDRSGGDRVDLMERILESLRAQMGARTVRLSDRAIQSLLNYSWPGNVRELRNVLERAIILAGGAGAGVIDPEHLPLAVRSSPLDSGWRTESEGKLPTLVEIERDHVERTLRALGGNRTRAAESLGVTRATLLRKIQRFGLEATGKNEE
jgi:transcriptional regulator with GAF, ATPase, and Fis domain